VEVKNIKVSDLIPYVNNARTHSAEQVSQISASIKEFGFNNPILSDGNKGIIAGHGRLQAAVKLKLDTVPVIELSHLSDIQKKAYILADNKLAMNAGWDEDLLKLELDGLLELDFDIELTGFDDSFLLDCGDDGYGANDEKHILLKDRFVVPPFSVLDTRQGYWQERKKAWKELIKDKAESRENAVAFQQTIKRGNDLVVVDGNGVSLLDPVLAEIAVKWFGITGGRSFDCFAGDSVFGYVASYEGQSFTGIELRNEQVELNNRRILEFSQSQYICDDGQNVMAHIKKGSQDLLFSCPPYFDLEVYSDNDKDASNQGTYEDFLLILEKAFTNAIKCLKDNRFAFIVVGDVRNKKTGGYYGFPDDIKKIFKDAGMLLYNEMILVEMIGTAMLRVGRYMRHRKLAKTHQNVLVFYKGDTKKIKETFPELVIEEPEIDSEDME